MGNRKQPRPHLKIAQVAPLVESVPPKLYGGTERVISWLTEELVHQGHDVTLFASGDSVTTAHLVACSERALRLDPESVDPLPHAAVELDQVSARADEFDIIHWHLDFMSYPLSRFIRTPHVTTLHGRLDLRDLVPLYKRFPQEPVVSISNAQRAPFPSINWQGTVYHGLPRDLYHYHPTPGEYMAFLGRIAPEKGVDRAIEIAKRSGIKLKIAAKIDPVDRDYYEDKIRPLMDTAVVEYVGEIDEHGKDEFLGNACATLFPIEWPEPFGLVMIESMACGTPLIAFRGGSVREVMEEGVTGFVVNTVSEAVAAIGRIPKLSRARCRQYVEQNFTAERMANDYVSIYHRLIEAHGSPEHLR